MRQSEAVREETQLLQRVIREIVTARFPTIAEQVLQQVVRIESCRALQRLTKALVTPLDEARMWDLLARYTPRPRTPRRQAAPRKRHTLTDQEIAIILYRGLQERIFLEQQRAESLEGFPTVLLRESRWRDMPLQTRQYEAQYWIERNRGVMQACEQGLTEPRQGHDHAYYRQVIEVLERCEQQLRDYLRDDWLPTSSKCMEIAP